MMSKLETGVLEPVILVLAIWASRDLRPLEVSSTFGQGFALRSLPVFALQSFPGASKNTCLIIGFSVTHFYGSIMLHRHRFIDLDCTYPTH